MIFFTGIHQPSDAKRISRAFVSVNRLRSRRTFQPDEWIMDSGAFTEQERHGAYRHSVDEYAREIRRWAPTGTLLAAVAQDQDALLGEAADLVFHLLVLLRDRGLGLDALAQTLQARHQPRG